MFFVAVVPVRLMVDDADLDTAQAVLAGQG